MAVELHRYLIGGGRDVVESVDRWVTGLAWIAENETHNPESDCRRWRDRRSAAVLRLVVVADEPLAVSVGWEPPDCPPCRSCARQARRVDRALRYLEPRLVNRGTVSYDAVRFAATLGEAATWARALAADQRRLRAIEATLGHRGCPRCAAWSSWRASTCRACDYRFTSADDRLRDVREQAARRECVQLLGGRAEAGR